MANRLLAIGIGVGLGVSTLFGTAVIKSKESRTFCVLKKIYDNCHNLGKKKKILGNQEKCKDLGARLGAVTHLYLVKEGKSKKSAEKVGEIFAITCYAGCMNKTNIRKTLAEKCEGKK
jgi:hypothetical protein